MSYMSHRPAAEAINHAIWLLRQDNVKMALECPEEFVGAYRSAMEPLKGAWHPDDQILYGDLEFVAQQLQEALDKKVRELEIEVYG